jgi:chromosomal replication initiation ATPase DnaA
MSNIDDELSVIIKRLAKTIKKVGVKKVVAALDELNTEEGFIEAHESLIKFTIKETSNSFQVRPEDLKKKNIRGITVEARSMCFVLLKKHLDYKHQDIAGIFGSRNHSLVSAALKEFKELDYDIRQDRKFLEIFKEVDNKVEHQKNILWLKHS